MEGKNQSLLKEVTEYSKSKSNVVKEDNEDGQTKYITCYLILVACVCFFGSSLQFGYNLSNINAPEQILKDFHSGIKKFDTLIWPIAVSIFSIGGMCGAFIGPHIARRAGRKKTLMLNNLIAMIGGLLLFITKYTDANSESAALLIIGRIILGVNAGINSSVAPMYLSEIAPVKLRGSLGTLNQFGIVTGILLGNILGLSELLGNEDGWNYILGTTAFIAVLQLCALPFCPESPRYLIAIKDNEHAATISLQKLRGIEDVSDEVNEIKMEAFRQSTIQTVSVLGLLKNSSYHKPLLISVVMQLAQQLSGFTGILCYSTTLFGQVGLPMNQGQAASCGIGLLSVICTAIAVVLVEVKGRKFLMLLGLGGMGIFYSVVTVAFYYAEKNDADWAKILGVVSILLVVVFFQFGPGGVPWYIVAELFSQQEISAAVSITGPINWFSNFTVGFMFPSMKTFYPYTFIPFIGLLLLFFIFTLFVVPETKGLTILEIHAKLKQQEYGEDVTESEHEHLLSK